MANPQVNETVALKGDNTLLFYCHDMASQVGAMEINHDNTVTIESGIHWHGSGTHFFQVRGPHINP